MLSELVKFCKIIYNYIQEQLILGPDSLTLSFKHNILIVAQFATMQPGAKNMLSGRN